MINVKILVKDKFWIIEENGQKLGTLQKQDTNGWIFLGKTSKETFHTKEDVVEKFGDVFTEKSAVKPKKQPIKQAIQLQV